MRRSSLLGLLLIIIGVFFLFTLTSSSFSWDSLWSKISKDINYERQFAVEKIEELDIETSSTNIEFVQSKDNQGRALLTGKVAGLFGKKVELNVDEQQNKLVIRSKHNSIGIGYFSAKLVIELPEKVWNKVTVNSTSGNIKLNHLQAAESQIKLNSGNLTVDQLISQKADLDATSGNLKVTNSRIASLSLKTNSGGITANIMDASQIQFKSTSGNVTINGETIVVDGKVTSGNVKLTADEIIGDSKLQVTSGNITVNLKKAPVDLAINYEGSSGTGRIKQDGFKYTYEGKHNNSFKGAFGEGSIALNVKTSSGNFTLQ
ncbi:DUF4097 family beta strand repeat-containing protein [Paenibacillus sp. IITD108]|uniref:DUF4097 family beta strand repeat-containing protein n=1 Tax=Paenibacillus sp. IITD108 TaxID=3116649 RepID=UPI002F3FFD6E